MITNITQIEGGYRAVIDGIEMFIPVISGNRHYQMLLEAIADGATVAQDIGVDQAEVVRGIRNQSLSSSDWVVIKSVENNEPVPTNWSAYRQNLRDVTSQEGFPYSVVWPIKPL